MKELTSIFAERGSQFIQKLFNSEVTVSEKLSGSSFSFKKINNKFFYFKGNIQRPINLVDRTLMVYYEPVINFIELLPENVKQQIPNDTQFCFQYFVHNEPGIIKYQDLPKNNLVLTHITDGQVINDDPILLKKWGDLFDVAYITPIFSGYLSDKQKEKIISFLSLSIEDRTELFGSRSYIAHIVKILNPKFQSFLLQPDINSPIDSLIFKFTKNDKSMSVKMIDPYLQQLVKNSETHSVYNIDTNEIILVDVLSFILTRGINKTDFLSNDKENKYIELLSNIFNDYVNSKKDLQNIEIDKAKFVKGSEFDVNLKLIKSDETRRILKQSKNYENLYKIILGSFRRKRNEDKESVIMNAQVIQNFNRIIDKINELTEPTEIKESTGFKTFFDFESDKNTKILTSYDLEESITDDYNNQLNEVITFTKRIDSAKLNLKSTTESVQHKPNQENLYKINIRENEINLYLDSFQPITNEHIKTIENLHKLNGLPVIIGIIKDDSILTQDQQLTMLSQIITTYDFIKSAFVLDTNTLASIKNHIKEDYIVKNITSSKKFIWSELMEEPLIDKKLDFVWIHNTNSEDIQQSEEKSLESIELNNEEDFQKLVPVEIHNYFKLLPTLIKPE